MMPRLPMNIPRWGIATISPKGVTRFCSGMCRDLPHPGGHATRSDTRPLDTAVARYGYCKIVGVYVQVQFSAPFIEKLFASAETETGPPFAMLGMPRNVGSTGDTCNTTFCFAPGIGRMEQPPG